MRISNDYGETFGPTLKLSKTGTIDEEGGYMKMSLHEHDQQLLKHELSISQILRTYGKQFRQIRKLYSDERGGRCAIGVVMSYFGWDGKHHSDASESLQTPLHTLKDAGINSGTIIKLNDSGYTFDEIADYLENVVDGLT
jgi:hypothetical protein